MVIVAPAAPAIEPLAVALIATLPLAPVLVVPLLSPPRVTMASFNWTEGDAPVLPRSRAVTVTPPPLPPAAPAAVPRVELLPRVLIAPTVTASTCVTEMAPPACPAEPPAAPTPPFVVIAPWRLTVARVSAAAMPVTVNAPPACPRPPMVVTVAAAVLDTAPPAEVRRRTSPPVPPVPVPALSPPCVRIGPVRAIDGSVVAVAARSRASIVIAPPTPPARLPPPAPPPRVVSVPTVIVSALLMATAPPTEPAALGAPSPPLVVIAPWRSATASVSVDGVVETVTEPPGWLRPPVVLIVAAAVLWMVAPAVPRNRTLPP